MSAVELHNASKLALSSHFEHCPHRCEATHIKCLLGWDLVAIEERAWFAARKELLNTNARYGEAAS